MFTGIKELGWRLLIGARDLALDGAEKVGFSKNYLYLLSLEHELPWLTRFLSSDGSYIYLRTPKQSREDKEISLLSQSWDTIPVENLLLQDKAMHSAFSGSSAGSGAVGGSTIEVELAEGETMEAVQKEVEAWKKGWICSNGRIHAVPFVWAPFKSRKAVEEALVLSYKRVAKPDSIVLEKRGKEEGRFRIVNPSAKASVVVEDVDSLFLEEVLPKKQAPKKSRKLKVAIPQTDGAN